jgi:hypothetical protein
LHTFTGKYGTNIFHNGDYSGYVVLLDTDSGNEMNVEMEDLLDFVAAYVRSTAIERLEQMATAELLKLWKGE